MSSMGMSFDAMSQGFFDFESFNTPENMEVFWSTTSKGDNIGESLGLFNNNDFNNEFVKGLNNNNNNSNNNNNNKTSNKRKTMSSETKNVAALKSHCEAERRRRERINNHLANLRNFVPTTHNNKMDKATLLAEVIRQVKDLKNQALEATKGLLIPTDADEVVVVPYDDKNYSNDDVFVFKASVCSEYKLEIIPTLRRVIKELKLNIVKAEISTLGGRVKNVFTISGKRDEIGCGKREKFAKSIHKAMSSALEKISSLEEYSPRAIYPSKRRRVAHSD